MEELLFAEKLFFLKLIPPVSLKKPRVSVYLLILAEYQPLSIAQNLFPFLSPYFSLP